MQVSSSGTNDLHALVMFVVDAGKPFSSPAALPRAIDVPGRVALIIRAGLPQVRRSERRRLPDAVGVPFPEGSGRAGVRVRLMIF